MEHQDVIPYFRELVVFLAAAGIVVPVFHRLRVSPVLGFLLVGVAIGPYGLARFADLLPALQYITIGELDGVRLIAEFGVMFLLFTIGLDLPLDRLWQLRRLVFGLGLLQVVLTAAAIAAIALMFGNTLPGAIVLGSCLALSSTAMVMQLLMETRRSATPLGRSSFAVLLLQDLAVVPILLLLGFMAAAQQGDGDNAGVLLQVGETLLSAAVALGGIMLFGRFLLAPLYRLVGAAKSPELFMALTLLVVIAMAAVTGLVGLSMALGAFLAGLLLSESEYRHAVDVSIEPFKGLLLGLFFLSVGMGIDLRVALDHAGWLLLSVVGLFVIKGGIIGLLALLFGRGRVVALEMALLLGQGGEFAFVVLGMAERLGLLELQISQFMLLVVSLSMALTPLTAMIGRRIARKAEHRDAERAHDFAGSEALEGHVVICGFGRVGQTIAGLLEAERIPWAALDQDSATVARERSAGRPVHYGDASRSEMLQRLKAAQAQALVVTLDDPAAAGRLVAAVHRTWPHLPVLARARDATHAEHLRKLGASEVVAEAEEASLQLGSLALLRTGLPDEAVRLRLERSR